MGEQYPVVKVAAVQTSPAFLNKEASTEKVCDLIREAGKGGAKVIVFPEGVIPSHPVWHHFHPDTDAIGLGLNIELYKNSVEVPGPEVDQLCQAAKDANAYVMVGICERRKGMMGTMYNTMLFLGPDGKLLFKHQKFMPTAGERCLHALGGPETMGVVPTEFGPISGLLCSENSNPLAIFSYIMGGTVIHGAAWPNHWNSLTRSMKKFVSIATLNFAQMSKAYVVSACGTVNDDMIEKLQLTPEQEKIIRAPEFTGGSMIASPLGDIIAGPMGDEEGILYADCDLEVCVRTKMEHDYSGHYNRPDIFTLYQNKAPLSLYVEVNERPRGAVVE